MQYALLPALALVCGVRPSVGIAAGLTGALLPINFWAETKGSFETPLAGVMLLLTAIVSGWRWRGKHCVVGFCCWADDPDDERCRLGRGRAWPSGPCRRPRAAILAAVVVVLVQAP
ncbi:MAG: hypothetical protein R2748_11355 [Bryobacterales bacterium]